jgi:hypothetical protein
LELYKASNASISKTETILDNIGAWSGSLLMEQLRSYGVQKVPIFEEVLARKKKIQNIVDPTFDLEFSFD